MTSHGRCNLCPALLCRDGPAGPVHHSFPLFQPFNFKITTFVWCLQPHVWPATHLADCQKWNMPDSRGMKQPPMVTAGSPSSSLGLRAHGLLAQSPYSYSGSASSSLNGLEQSIQPFQDFIKQTRPAETEKPLPPVPRYLFDSTPRSEDVSRHIANPPQDVSDRRSSSVYSQTPSQWLSDTSSLQYLDIDFDSCLLQPGSYSSNIPDLNVKKAAPEVREPRGYSPLFTSPSPTLSAVSTFATSTLSTLVLSPDLLPERPKARLMSMEKANQAFSAPGVIHLLPEEQRAQSSKKIKARAAARRESREMYSSPRPPPLPPAALSLGEERSQSISTDASVSPHSKPQRMSIHRPPPVRYGASVNSFHVGAGPARTMIAPPVTTRTLDYDEQRGRSKQRERASREVATPETVFMHDLIPRAVPEHRSNSSREQSETPSYNSEDDVRGHMKMIPQPLFQTRSPKPQKRPSDASIPSSFGHFHFRMQRDGRESASSGQSSAGGFQLRSPLTPPPGSMWQRQSQGSKTGMIPISPPSENGPSKQQILPKKSSYPKVPSKGTHRQETSILSLYPHIIDGMKKKVVSGNAKPVVKRPSVGAPLLPADVVAAVLLTPETTPQTSPLASNLILSTALKGTPSHRSVDSKKPLYQRFKGMTKHARRASKQHDVSPARSLVARPDSPHLFANSVKAAQSTYSEWSETAKATWEQARFNAFPSRDEASHNESESGIEDFHARRPTLFNPLMDSYRETKALKRREELKRTIKVLTPMDEASDVGESEEESDGHSVVDRRLSGYNWI